MRRLAVVLTASMLLGACTPDEPASAPTPSASQPGASPVQAAETDRSAKFACFVAAIQRETRDELALEIGARSPSPRHLVDVLVSSLYEDSEEDEAALEAGCKAGLRRSGVLRGTVLPMSSSNLVPVFVEMCRQEAQRVPDPELLGAALDSEGDAESLGRALIGLLAEQRGVRPPEVAVQACTQGFARGYANL